MAEPRRPTVLYRGFFLDKKGDVAAFEDIPADHPSDAIEWAVRCLAVRSHHAAVEVWQGGRRIYPTAKAA